MSIGLRSFIFYNVGLGRKIPAVDPSDLFPQESISVTLDAGFGACGGLSPQEGLLMVLLAARMRCTAVFEIGTCSGRTTYNLACNIPGIVYTLDLPPTTRDTLLPVEKADHAFMGIEDSQKYWIGKPQADRIVQLQGDSADFDFTPYYKRMDLVFVDGSHAYHYVRKDSESALALVQDSGAIVWHDYAPCWPGVVRALNELASRVSLVNLKGTSLVVYRKE